jgi:ribosomal protein S27E
VGRTRTTKKLAQRIDLNYFKRPTPLKRAKFLLSLLLPLLALIWISWRGFSGDHRVYSSGRMSRAHAVLEKECAACHVQKTGVFSAKATDRACLDCHDGPVHHAVSLVGKKELVCAECHAEHRGQVNLSAVSNGPCATCHVDLNGEYAPSNYTRHIRSLEDGHPEFAALRKDGPNYGDDLSGIKLNHAIHMKSIRRGPAGPFVQLECADCHRPTVVSPSAGYSDSTYVGAKTTYKESFRSSPLVATNFLPRHARSGRELMAPVKFANACAGCHLLTFDKRFDSGVPHDQPEVVRRFLLKKFQEYIAAHPAELRVSHDPNRALAGKPEPSAFRMLLPGQWAEERTSDAEELLWRKTCVQCHALTMRFMNGEKPGLVPPWLRSTDDNRSVLRPLPEIGYALTTLQWMPHAKFDHDAHRGFTCVSCHAKALTSTESSDILLPGIETCKTCHAPGPDHADSRCSECHTYHDWSKRKEVIPKFTLPALRTGGR